MTILPLSEPGVEAQAEYMKTSPLLRERVAARVRAASLDRRLAAGCPAWSEPALAARAERLVSPAGRRQIVRGWNNVLRRAGQPPFMPRPPLRRDTISAAEPDVRYLLARLAGPRPVAARGAAMAMVLLTDGTGPVHNQRARASLTAAVLEAIRQLDPGAADQDPRPARGPADHRPGP
jgi:hypothetical protein